MESSETEASANPGAEGCPRRISLLSACYWVSCALHGEVRVVANLLLVLSLLLGGSGGMWLCVADDGLGLFAHAHVADDGCATPCGTDTGSGEGLAATAMDCCDDLLLGGWITALKAGADQEATAPSPCSQLIRVVPIAALHEQGAVGVAPAQAQWPPTRAPALALLSTVVLRL